MHRKKKKGFVKNITGIAQTKQNQEKSKLRQALCVQLNQGYILNLFKRAKAELFCAADSSSSRQMLPSMARSWAVLLLCLSACSGAHPLPLWDKHILQHCLRQSWRQEEQTLSWSSPCCFLHGKCQWGAPRYPRDSTSYLACFGFPQMSLLLLPPAPPPPPFVSLNTSLYIVHVDQNFCCIFVVLLAYIPGLKYCMLKMPIYTSILRQLFCQILPGSLMGWVRFPAGKIRQQQCKPIVQSPGKLNAPCQVAGRTNLSVYKRSAGHK